MSTKKLLALSDSRNVITTIIGGGKAPFKDRGLAQEAILEGPSAVAVDEEDNIYIAGFLANRVFKIDTKGRISAFAGTGEKITSGDGGPAVDAGLNGPSAIAVDGGLVYIAEQLSDRIRVVDTNGVINTFAGNGRGGLVVDGKREPIKDGVHATKAPLEQPAGLAIRDGELYFTEFAGNRVRKVNKDGTLSTVAGTGERTSAGDGGPATEASLQGPTGILVDHRGRVYVSEVFSARIRRIDEKGRITTVAGLGKSGQPADGDRARGARLRWPHGLALDEEDNLYVADFAANRVYAIGRDGLINTIAGTGKGGPLKAGRATTGPIENPLGLAIDSSGGLLITLFNQGSLVRIDPKGRVEHLVGQPSKRRATQASPGEAYLKGVGGVTSDVKGNIYVAEVFGNTVHRVTPSARMTTFTGSGFARSSGDSNGASDAEVNHPVGLWPHNGGLFVAEADGHRIRFIDEDGVITTIAGTGEPGFLGDGGRGADALMAHP
ncbi:MAG TPA: NHL repeat-containing protein, partial [Blastocatellia bacterium]|nr:NHL repeat-containing protein [Blastocatellia bacterium]